MSSPEDFIIVRKRKKYKFARFAQLENCFEASAFTASFRDELIKNKPLTVELGAGTGLFSVELARRYQKRCFIAIDVKADRLYQGAREAAELGLKNIYFVRAAANHLLELFKQHSLQDLWLTFPDPFPKKRAAKHRLTHRHFLETYRQLLASNGTMHFKTDNLWLFHWSLEQFVAEKMQLTFLSFDVHKSEVPADYKIETTYEKRYLKELKPICALDAYFTERGEK